ncbi:MAG TPA: hypothetical protein VF790_08215 [Dissulfurispiraceae bacterium]
MGLLLALGYYIVTLVFLGEASNRLLNLWKVYRTLGAAAKAASAVSVKAIGKAFGDMLILSRLMKTNDALWLGEWLFHCSFVLVGLRHLRYFLDPVPGWIAFLQPAGIVAGYLLPVALAYILTMKLAVERKYFSSYNFFLLALLISIGLTGILLRTVFRTDVEAVKLFMIGIFRLSPAAAPGGPGGLLFIVHYLLVLVLVLYLPTHIFTAPFVMIDARDREEELKRLIHD